MKCKYIKGMFSEYLDDVLEPNEKKLFENHLNTCLKCKNEFEVYQRTLESLNKWKSIEPDSQYMARFWAKVEENEQKSGIIFLSKLILNRRLVYGLAVIGIIFIILSGPLQNYLINKQLKTMLSELDEESIEMLDKYELIKNFNLVENIDYIDEM